MKHSLLISAIASLMLCLAQPIDAQRHRHHSAATQTTTTNVDNKSANNADDASTYNVDPANAIDAYSDTTSLNVDTTSATTNYTFDNDDDDFDDFPIPFKEMLKMMGISFGGVVIFFVVFFLVVGIFIVLPLVLIVLLIRKLTNHHNDNIVSTAQGTTTIPVKPDYWTKGVTNISIGVGLILMGMMIKIDIIFGAGAVVACMGLGQIFIARKQSKKNDDDKNDWQIQ